MLGNMDSIVTEIDYEEANFLLAVTVITEILESKHTKQQMDQFEKFRERPNVITADTTVPIAMKARKIRSDGDSEGRKIKTPDATIMATAIIYKANVLHTMEPKLIALSGLPIVDGLVISEPISLTGQPSIDFKS